MEQSRKAFQALRPCASNPSIKVKQRFWEQIQVAQIFLSETEQKLLRQKLIPEFNDSEAQPIHTRKLNQAVEFGRTLQLVQDSSGVVLSLRQNGTALNAAPGKSSLGIKPKELAADRGYYSTENVVQLEKTGIEKVGSRQWVV